MNGLFRKTKGLMETKCNHGSNCTFQHDEQYPEAPPRYIHSQAYSSKGKKGKEKGDEKGDDKGDKIGFKSSGKRNFGEAFQTQTKQSKGTYYGTNVFNVLSSI